MYKFTQRNSTPRLPGTGRLYRTQQRLRTPPPYLLIFPALVAVAMILPLFYLAIRAFEGDLDTLISLVFRRRTAQLLFNTLQLTAGVLGVTTAVGLPLAWLATRTDVPGRRLITLLSVMPLAIPGYVVAHSLLSVGGTNGLLAAFGYPVPRPTGLLGATIALSIYSFPYMFLNIRTSLLGMDPATEEVARSMGHRPARVFISVVLPMLVPGLLAGWLIITLYTLGDFGAVALMRYEVFSYVIYTQYIGAFDRVYASALSLILLLLTAGPVFLEAHLLRSGRFSRIGTGAARRIRPIHLGPWKPVAVLFLVFVFAVSLGLPVLTLVFQMFVRPPWAELPAVVSTFTNSARAAVPAAILATLIAIPIGYLRVRYPSRASFFADRTAYIGFAIPPLALALALVFFSLRAAPFLYQRLPLLVAAFTLNFLALAMGPIRSALLKTPKRLEEAARSLGVGPVAAFFRTVLPAMREGITASFLLVFVMAMKELPMTALLAPTGFRTLSVAVFSRTSEALATQAAPYAAAIVLFSTLFVGLILRYEGNGPESL